MFARVVAVCDGTLGRGAHIPAGKSTHAVSRKPTPVLWWVNINEGHEWYTADQACCWMDSVALSPAVIEVHNVACSI